MLTIHPVTPERWPDVEALFGPHGADGGCWCMWWRSTHRAFRDNLGDGNRNRLKTAVDSLHPQGLLAYIDDQVAGWCSVSPRDQYPRVHETRTWRPVDDQEDGVWAVVCFFIHPDHRGKGISGALLDAALDFARANGARIVEAYPRETPPGQAVSVGMPGMYLRRGFQEVARRNSSFPILRLSLD